MESKFYEEDKLLVFKITDEMDDHNVQMIRRKADYEIGRYKFAKMLGAKLELSNLTQSVKKIFEMSGILKLISVA